MGRILSPSPGADLGSGEGGFGGEASSGFKLDNNNDDTNNDFSFGGGENKEDFWFGNAGAKGAGDFSFFGGGEEDKGGETQRDVEGFSFSFGGVEEGSLCSNILV